MVLNENCPKCQSNETAIEEESDEYHNGIPCIIRVMYCRKCDCNFTHIYDLAVIDVEGLGIVYGDGE